MIADEQLQLLTAAVDGELTPGQLRQFLRLIDESPEAALLYARLRADRERLQALPRATAPAGLRDRIIARVAAITPVISPAPVRIPAVRPAAQTRAARTRTYLPLATAASLLLAVTGVSFWFFARPDQSNRRRADDLAAAGKYLPPDTVTPTETPRGAAAQNQPPQAVPAPPDHKWVAESGATPAPVEPAGPDLLPAPRPKQPSGTDPFTAPLIQRIPLNHAQIRIPFLVGLADLERADDQQLLVEELTRDPCVRIDLFARDSGRGAEAFQAAARAAGLTVHVDATAQALIRQKLPVSFVLYTEALTATELRNLFAQLAGEDAKAATRLFGDVHVMPVHPQDAGLFKAVFGIEPPAKRLQPAPVVPAHPESKPISAGTSDMITRSLLNPPGKSPEKPAVLMTFGPDRARVNPAVSQELQHFLKKRGDRRPDAVPVMIVIRPPNG